MADAIVLLLAGGSGVRLGGDIPKQYIEIEGRMIIDRCIESISKCELISGIQIVADSAWREHILDTCLNKEFILGFSDPGENRALSILNGLNDLANDHPEDTAVIIHDAARPLVSDKLLCECIEGLVQYDGIMPVLPMKDTVYYKGDNGLELLERDRVCAGQAPEAFRLGVYLKAYQSLGKEKLLNIKGSTEPALLAGLRIGTIEGDESNLKITTKEDLERYRIIIEHSNF